MGVVNCPHCGGDIVIAVAPLPRRRAGDSAGKVAAYGTSWPLQRALAFSRDGGRCQSPDHDAARSANARLLVHHIKPLRDFNGDTEAANQLSNLITLCNPCHGAEHSRMQRGA
jgi:5-methylcytosine-specific restriction endonuclease McrA